VKVNSTSGPDFDPVTTKKIEDYISGNMNADDIEELWAFFILNPEWYTYFETYLTMISLSRQP